MLAAFALAALWVVCAPLAARILIVRAEPRSADAMIVLSGSPVYAERLRQAAALYSLRRAPHIILTDDGLAGRWSRREQRNPRTVERGTHALLAAGVPSDRIVLLPERVHSTRDEAYAARRYARANGLKSLLVVTSPYHSRRALWVFRRILSEDGVAVGIEPVATGDQSPVPERWWLSRQGWNSVAAEYVKFPYYFFTLP